ncbi:hypothetical protein ACFL9U_09900 [Thermodesulfobacteriota bacterium]
MALANISKPVIPVNNDIALGMRVALVLGVLFPACIGKISAGFTITGLL